MVFEGEKKVLLGREEDKREKLPKFGNVLL
jgi:hypothetical protein